MDESIGIGEKESFFKKNNNVSVLRENGKLDRITFLDKRVYQTPTGEYVPSVTSILSALPPSPFFMDWVKETGFNADIIRDRAAKEGTQVHEGIEDLLKGEDLQWVDEYGNAKYGLHVWRMLLRFKDFYSLVKPETLASEQFIYSEKYGFAGTVDYLSKVNVLNDKKKPETWLLDFKSSNHIGLSYDLQLAAYAKGLEEKGIKIDRCGVLWLKASTRTQRYTLKGDSVTCQGEGWQISFVDDIDRAFEVFQHVHEIYKVLNPKIEPYTKTYPVEISLK